MSFLRLFSDKGIGRLPIGGIDHTVFDGFPSRGHFIQYGYVQIPIYHNGKVLGIGVALMTRTWVPFPLSARSSLCLTPKRCCSSVITRDS